MIDMNKKNPSEIKIWKGFVILYFRALSIKSTIVAIELR